MSGALSHAASVDPFKRPTLRTIAIEAGVTHATVSMALRNHPMISAKTRKKIHQIADKVGYRPDPEVARLMHHLRLTHKPRFKSMIAALTSIPEEFEPRYAAALSEGARRSAEALGYGFAVFRFDETSVQRNTSLQRILVSRGVKGVLLLPMKSAVSLVELLDWNFFAVEAATYGVLAPDFHRVVPDQFGNTLLICEQLARLGCRRIGLITDARTDLTVEHRFSAAVLWKNTMGGAEYVSPLMHNGDYRIGLKAWFERQQPDALIAGKESDVRVIAHELDLRVPGRVKFAVTEREKSEGSVGGIDQRPAEIGAAAIAQLHARIQNGEKGPPEVPSVMMIKGHWIRSSPTRRNVACRAKVF